MNYWTVDGELEGSKNGPRVSRKRETKTQPLRRLQRLQEPAPPGLQAPERIRQLVNGLPGVLIYPRKNFFLRETVVLRNPRRLAGAGRGALRCWVVRRGCSSGGSCSRCEEIRCNIRCEEIREIVLVRCNSSCEGSARSAEEDQCTDEGVGASTHHVSGTLYCWGAHTPLRRTRRNSLCRRGERLFGTRE